MFLLKTRIPMPSSQSGDKTWKYSIFSMSVLHNLQVRFTLYSYQKSKCWRFESHFRTHRSSGLADEDISGSFWNYIFLQYGFKSENSEAAANRLYNYFRGAIKGTLAHYKRFFAPEGTQQYYTSLLLHALAPKQSIESLYSILFDFYVKNLDFQYVTGYGDRKY